MGGYGLGDRMSGPITPPLTVTEVDGAPSGRPITTIKVSNGDLSISGDVATIDTSGSGGTPGGSTTEIQYNNAGAFAGDAGLTIETVGAGATTVIQSGNMLIGGSKVAAAASNGTVSIICDGTGQIMLQSGSDAGGTWTDSIVNISAASNTDSAQLKFRDNSNADNGTITLNGSGDMVLSNSVANKDVDLHILGTGQVEIENQTTDNDTTLSVKGNGTGDAKIHLNNPSKAVSLICDTNQKLKIQGGSDTFVFDASSATGGITFPDATELISAEGTAILATGVTDGYVLTADGAGASAWEAAGGGGATDIDGLSDGITADYDNVGLGSNALSNLTPLTSNSNVALGVSAGRDIDTGSSNTCVGHQAGGNLESSTTGVAIGYRSAYGTGSKDQHNFVAVGGNAGRDTGTGQVAVGYEAGYDGAIGVVAVGYGAGKYVELGDNTIAIGYLACVGASGTQTSGNDNIAIGKSAQTAGFGTGENNVVIGQVSVVIDTDDQLKLASGDGGITWIEGDSAGSCYQGDNASTWSTTSDERLKENITNSTKGLDIINQITVRNFNYIEKATPITEESVDDNGIIRTIITDYDGDNRYNLDPEPLRTGFIAQEIENILPEAVKENVHGHKTVDIDPVIYSLVNAVKELSAKVETLEAMIE